MWVCDAGLSDDLVYKITKTFWENVDDLYQVHARARQITLDTALEGVSVPVHPGAAKYYKEIGMEVPAIE
jgi:hypothetical protein